MDTDEVTRCLRAVLPDAEVALAHRPGGTDHVSLHVISEGFRGMALLDRQRLVYRALGAAMQDRRLKALAVRADLPEAGPRSPTGLPACDS